MKRTSLVTSLCLSLLVALGACGDDPTFQLIFGIDASFQGPHGGKTPAHAIMVAVVRTSDGVVVAQETGSVSATAGPRLLLHMVGSAGGGGGLPGPLLDRLQLRRRDCGGL